MLRVLALYGVQILQCVHTWVIEVLVLFTREERVVRHTFEVIWLEELVDRRVEWVTHYESMSEFSMGALRVNTARIDGEAGWHLVDAIKCHPMIILSCLNCQTLILIKTLLTVMNSCTAGLRRKSRSNRLWIGSKSWFNLGLRLVSSSVSWNGEEGAREREREKRDEISNSWDKNLVNNNVVY